LNKYQVALQGQVIENGIAFILTLITINSESCSKKSKAIKEKEKTKKK
jgi:hypothetical protein